MTISRKISPYIIGGTNTPLRRADADARGRALPTFVVMVDCSVAYHAQMRALMGPDVLIEMRRTEPNDYQPLDDPERRADEWWARNQAWIMAIPAGDNTIFAGYNEKPKHEATAFCRFEMQRLAHLHNANRRAAVGSWSVGRPDTDEWAIYAPLVASMRPGDVWDLHEYASDYEDLDNRWHIGRFTIPAIASNLGDWPIVISEFGYDVTPDTGKGWPGWQLQPGANNDTCLAMLRKGGQFYDAQKRVIGVAAYQMGSVDPKFAAFDMYGVWPQVVSEYETAVVEPDPPEEESMLRLVPPIDKERIVSISQPWGPTATPPHFGIDFSCYEGTPIYAAVDGIAYPRTDTAANGGFGKYIRVETCDGKYKIYTAHLNAWGVVEGQRVTAGQQIGWSGNTGHSSGPHLHFEVRRTAGSPYRYGAIDPTELIEWPEMKPEPEPTPYLPSTDPLTLAAIESGDVHQMASKDRWWRESAVREAEAENWSRALAIMQDLVDREHGLAYIIERALEAQHG